MRRFSYSSTQLKDLLDIGINKMKNKKAVSLMVSYVLLVSIVIIVSIGVFAWLRSVANISPPIDCKEGTSIILEDYNCTSGVDGGIDLYLKNNGYFNIDGVILSVGNDTGIFPVVYLMPEFSAGFQGNIKGHSFFNETLGPGEIISANFSNIDGQDMETVDFNNIRIIQIQPFVVEKTGRVICQNAVIKQNIENCIINQ